MQTFWKTFILDYNTDQQKRVAQAGWDALDESNCRHAWTWRLKLPWLPRYWNRLPWLTVPPPAIGLLIWLFRRGQVRRRQQADLSSVGEANLYAHLLAVFAKHCRLIPRASETPQEFGTAAESMLRNHPALAALAAVPLQVVRVFYRVRYGGRPLHSVNIKRSNATYSTWTPPWPSVE